MERHRSRSGAWLAVKSAVPVARPERGGKYSEARNGLPGFRPYLYRPMQYDGRYVAFSATKKPSVIHILAPGPVPSSSCWIQLGDGDAKTYRLFDKEPKSARVCGFCWRVVMKEKGLRENG